ncbi:MAG TPA: nuclear transport factor 2 family protein [Flavitalea sp.]|nr:nuclear transport factor 2 family protein [Flavitalea sp.]
MYSKIVIFMLVTLFTCKDEKKEGPPVPQGSKTVEQIETEVRQLEEVEWSRAEMKKDMNWFHQHLADELVMTNGKTGEVNNKAEQLAEYQDSDFEVSEPDKISQFKVQAFDNWAVATFRLQMSGKNKNGKVSENYRFTDVWIFRDDRWQITASHRSEIPGSTKRSGK